MLSARGNTRCGIRLRTLLESRRERAPAAEQLQRRYVRVAEDIVRMTFTVADAPEARVLLNHVDVPRSFSEIFEGGHHPGMLTGK